MPGITSIEDRFPRPSVVGVVNVTPDSFSDGGDAWDTRIAIARGLEQFAAGAAIVDIGGESTRPGAEPVDPSEELAAGDRRGRGAVAARRDDLDRHAERRSRPGRGRGRRLAGQRRLGPAPRPAHGRRRGRRGRGPVPDAHARRRPADDAGRSALRRRRRRRRELPRGSPGRGRRRRGPRGAHLPRSRHRLRQDRRAQPRAPARASAARADRAPAARRRVAQVVPHAPHASGTAQGAPRRVARGDRRGLPRGASLLRVHDVAETMDALAIVRALEGGG